MFDGLKDKLGRFSSDVEEDIDEDAVEEDAPEDEAAATESPSSEEADASEAERAVDDSADASPTEEAAEPTDDPVPEEGDTDDAGIDSESTGEDGRTVGAAADPETDGEAAETDVPDGDAIEADTPDGDDQSDDDGGSLLSRLTGSSDDEDDGSVEDSADASAATPDESQTAERDDEADSEAESSADGEADPDEGDADDDRGLTEKAKLFATGKTVIDEGDLQDHLDDLEIALLQSDVEMSVAQEILDGVEANLTGQTRRRLESTGNLAEDALREALFDVISVGQFDFDQRIAEADKPVVIIFTGVNGVGKTTTIAKLSRYLEERGHSSVLANGDTYRAGANEQLEQHADNLGRKVISHEQGSDPAAVIYDGVEYAEANDVDVVLGDTAGRLHTNDGLMDQLEKIDRVIDPDMTLFVDEAVAGQDAVNRAREFDAAAAVDGAILTKADADPQGGAAISIAHVTGKPILFLGTGQDYGDLTRFDPETIVDTLFAE